MAKPITPSEHASDADSTLQHDVADYPLGETHNANEQSNADNEQMSNENEFNEDELNDSAEDNNDEPNNIVEDTDIAKDNATGEHDNDEGVENSNNNNGKNSNNIASVENAADELGLPNETEPGDAPYHTRSG